jgi:class 3 adenylate cyclase
MFDKWIRIVSGVFLNVACYLFILYYYDNYQPLYTEAANELQKFYYLNTIVFLLALSILVYFLKQENIRVERMLKQNNRELKISRKKTENLLLNILPAEIAQELQAKGYVEPRYYSNVTVLFSDFHGFTRLAEKMRPLELVSELDVYFSAFDIIVEKYGLEKLKTIGDAFMCAGGLTTSDPQHAKKMVEAALEIRDFVQGVKLRRLESGQPAWDVRIGIHTGPLVAGIIGQKKFAFDIWGDTVNIASRMESSSEPGKINISGQTYDMVKDHFITVYRGKVAPKNKDEIDMYFVNGKAGIILKDEI